MLIRSLEHPHIWALYKINNISVSMLLVSLQSPHTYLLVPYVIPPPLAILSTSSPILPPIG